MAIGRGIRKVNENIVQPGRALIVTEEDLASVVNNENLPAGTIHVHPQTGVITIKTEDEDGNEIWAQLEEKIVEKISELSMAVQKEEPPEPQAPFMWYKVVSYNTPNLGEEMIIANASINPVEKIWFSEDL